MDFIRLCSFLFHCGQLRVAVAFLCVEISPHSCHMWLRMAEAHECCSHRHGWDMSRVFYLGVRDVSMTCILPVKLEDCLMCP